MFKNISNIARNISNRFFQMINLNNSKKSIENLIYTVKSDQDNCYVINAVKHIDGKTYCINITYDMERTDKKIVNSHNTVYYISYEKIGKYGDPVFYLRPYIKKDKSSASSVIDDK